VEIILYQVLSCTDSSTLEAGEGSGDRGGEEYNISALENPRMGAPDIYLVFYKVYHEGKLGTWKQFGLRRSCEFQNFRVIGSIVIFDNFAEAAGTPPPPSSPPPPLSRLRL
jgi:hypothetical protein